MKTLDRPIDERASVRGVMGNTRRQELERFADPGFSVPEAWTPDKIAHQEVARMRRFALMAVFAADFPRRLGPDAGGRDLADDKKLSKVIAYAYWKLWERLTMAKKAPMPAEELEPGFLPPDSWKRMHQMASADEGIRRDGATVDWNAWWDDLEPKLRARRRAVASFALDRDLLGWGYRIVGGISSEIDWIGRKFGDQD